jgi:hypothetical protein
MRTSEQINEIAAALAAAQTEVKNAKANSENPHFRSTYADLESVREACMGALNKQGIAVLQCPVMAEERHAGVITRLIHKSGQWIEGELLMNVVKNDPQGVGSCITYARRYSLAAFAGVATEDDDGNAASTPPSRPAQSAQRPVAKPTPKSVSKPAEPSAPLEGVAATTMCFGTKYKGTPIGHIPREALLKAAVAELTDPAELECQANIRKYLEENPQ